MYDRISNYEKGGPGPGSKDRRLTAVLAEKFVSLLNPYTCQGMINLPESPPYIIAANHDVLRGDYTNMPYDGVLLNHWLRNTRDVSPYWVAKLTSDSTVYKFGEASKYISPVIRLGFKALFDRVVRPSYISSDKCKDSLQDLIIKLQQGEVVCLFPTGSKYSTRVKAGVLYLSQKAGKGITTVPIVPVRISKNVEGKLRSSYVIEVQPPIQPTFKTGRLSKDEIALYTSQIQQSLYG